jgi:hypothetical protein
MKNKLTEKVARLSAFVLSLSFVLAAGANAQNSPPVAIDDFYGVDQLAALNEAAPGVLVNDSDPDVSNTLTAALVTGPLHARSFQLNSNGSFTYVPVADYYGPDTFTYHASDGTLSSETGTVNITVRQPCSTGGFITGGGKFFQDGRKCTFGFVAKVQGTGTQGNLEFQDHNMGLDVKAGTMAWVYAPNETDGSFSGACRVNGVDGHTFFAQVHDRGQPGTNDDFSVWVYDPYGAQIYTSGHLLSGGNILIHDTAQAGTSREWWCDYDGDGYTVSGGVSCTAPSPFCSESSGLGPDCNDNDPTATVAKHWYYDCDLDGWGAPAGESCTPPSCTPCQNLFPPSCPRDNEGSGLDCDDFDNTISGGC